jgi:prolyl-tRNA editing enzyme YbaK/EbsC (Cys-tRNA(Pro) deacylase)
MASEPELHRSAIAVRNAALGANVELTIHRFPDGTRTAQEAASAVGVEVGQIVKSLVFAIGQSPTDPAVQTVLALVSGANNLDERKLAALTASPKSWRVDADAVRLATGFPVGGVAPFGHRTPIPTWIDADLLNYDEVWAAAGTPEYVFPIDPKMLVIITNGTVAEIAKRASST